MKIHLKDSNRRKKKIQKLKDTYLNEFKNRIILSNLGFNMYNCITGKRLDSDIINAMIIVGKTSLIVYNIYENSHNYIMYFLFRVRLELYSNPIFFR